LFKLKVKNYIVFRLLYRTLWLVDKRILGGSHFDWSNQEATNKKQPASRRKVMYDPL